MKNVAKELNNVQAIKNKTTKEFKKLLIDNNTNQLAISNELGLSQQSFNERVNKCSFRYADFVAILDHLGYDVVWVKRHNAENKNDWGAEKPSAEKA